MINVSTVSDLLPVTSGLRQVHSYSLKLMDTSTETITQLAYLYLINIYELGDAALGFFLL